MDPFLRIEVHSPEEEGELVVLAFGLGELNLRREMCMPAILLLVEQ